MQLGYNETITYSYKIELICIFIETKYTGSMFQFEPIAQSNLYYKRQNSTNHNWQNR